MKKHIKKIAEKVSERRKELFIIFLIFLLGFSARAFLMKYNLFFEFDSYWHARVISYVIQTGTYPSQDPLAYYQIGGAPLSVGADFFWHLNANIYNLATFGTGYSKEVWNFFVKVLPAFYGGLICIALYYIGKLIYDKKAGMLLGFFGAIMPAFIYRQMAGWIEDDCFGFLPGLIGIYFLIRAIKCTSWKSKQFFTNTILSGFFIGIMGWSWSGFQTIPAIIIAFAVFALLAMVLNIKRDKAFAQNAGKVIIASGIAIAIMAVMVYPSVGLNWTGPMSSGLSKILPGGEGIISGEEGVIGRSVGEESVGIDYFGNKYNVLILLLPIGVLALILSAIKYKHNPKPNYAALMLLSIVIVTLIMGMSKLKFTYYFGLGMAIASGIACYWLFKITEHLKKGTRALVGLFVLFMVLAGSGAGLFFVSQNVPNIEYGNGWKEALYWAKSNTPKDAKFFNWWDEGHWITYVAERKATLDNRNYGDSSPIAKFMITYDENEAVDLVTQKPFESDYLIFGSDLLEKEFSLVNYAFKTTNPQDNPELHPYLSAYAKVSSCDKVEKISEAYSYNCGGYTLTQAQFDNLPTEWIEFPNQVTDREALFLYTSEDDEGNLKFYILTPNANASMLAKLWFNKENLQETFEQVYYYQDVKIFKVKK